VRYTVRGRALIKAAVAHVIALELAWSTQLGADRYAVVREALMALASPDPSPAPAHHAKR
jgi:hypothetical protein